MLLVRLFLLFSCTWAMWHIDVLLLWCLLYFLTCIIVLHRRGPQDLMHACIHASTAKMHLSLLVVLNGLHSQKKVTHKKKRRTFILGLAGSSFFPSFDPTSWNVTNMPFQMKLALPKSAFTTTAARSYSYAATYDYYKTNVVLHVLFCFVLICYVSFLLLWNPFGT